MGSQQSSDQRSKKNNLLSNISAKNPYENANMEFGGKDFSSYKGVRTDMEMSSSGKAESNTKDTNTPQSQQTNTVSNELVDVTFFWNQGGNDVFITGSFAQWTQWFMLEKKNEVFYIQLQLPKEKHFFKFIVDNQWICSNNYEITYDDKGQPNNVVDLKNLVFTSKQNDNSQQQNDTKIQNTKKVKKNPQITKIPQQNSYSEIYPDRSGLNSETPMIPSSYTNKFNLNNISFQSKIGKPNYIDLDFKELYSHSNSSTGEISLPPHINM